MYDNFTAIHYAAYRPKLHELILARCLKPNERFTLGLDIGCGTGRSAVALSKYCDKVIAIDPSEEMLFRAEPHTKISYIHMKENLDIPDKTYEIITFAGSLFYCKSQALYDRIIERSAPGTIIIVYDFNIRVEKTLTKLGLSLPQELTEYNHAEDFTDIKTVRLSALYNHTESISLPITLGELSHFLLSHHNIYQNLVKKYETADVYAILSKKLAHLSKDIIRSLQADLYYQKYKVI